MANVICGAPPRCAGCVQADTRNMFWYGWTPGRNVLPLAAHCCAVITSVVGSFSAPQVPTVLGAIGCVADCGIPNPSRSWLPVPIMPGGWTCLLLWHPVIAPAAITVTISIRKSFRRESSIGLILTRQHCKHSFHEFFSWIAKFSWSREINWPTAVSR
jgi:hypothetical protein